MMGGGVSQQPLTPALICAILGIGLYLNTLDCGLCFDDVSAITNNQDLRPNSPWSNLLWNDFWGTPMDKEGSHKSYRPLCVATFRLNYLVHDTEPLGYHLVNALLHGLVCFCFVWTCALTVFQSNPVPLWISGVCFAVHPIHTEAVAGVVGRAETLSVLFFLVCFHCYRRSIMAVQTTDRFMWLLMSLVSCLFSVLSKEQGITVLAVCICYEYFIVNKNSFQSSISLIKSLRSSGFPDWTKRFFINLLILVSFFVAIMVLRVKIMKAELPVFTVHDNPAVALSAPYRQLHWSYLVFQNVWLLLSPSHLCADWTMGTVPLIEGFSDPRNLLTLGTFICLTYLGLFSISRPNRDNHAVHFGLLLMVFPFLPASNLLFPVGFVIAERILYVPSMGYSILLATGFHKLFNSKSGFLRSVSKLWLAWLIAIHSLKTLERNRDWLSAETLFHSAIHVNPRNGKLFNNLGHYYETQGNHSYAKVLFDRASEVQPDDIGAFINLGRVLNVLKRPEESEQAYRRAIDLMPTGKTFRVAPSHINVYFNLANLLKLNNSRYEETMKLYKRAISMKPDFTEAHMNLGDLYLKLNRTEEAKKSFLNAIKHRLDYSDAYFNLATTNLQSNERTEAEVNYLNALKHDPNHIMSLFNLGMVYIEDKTPKKLQKAKTIFHRLLRLQPNNDKAHFQLGIAHSEIGEFQLAMDAFKKALEITPTYKAALYNLAYLQFQTKDLESSCKNLQLLKEFHPNHANGMQLLGDCYMRKNKVDEAIEAYSLCLKSNPQHVVALHNLGVGFTKKGKLAEAINYFSQALKINPSHEPSQKHLKQAKMQLSKEKEHLPKH